ncbi:MAG: chromosomal replication initiator DnaA [Alphaproteobacteria bacterium]|nr:chromosomal replication initiator DnaA [Alphaproteobacteria bacterium]
MTPPRQLVLPLPERVSLERDDYFVSASNRPALEAVEAWPAWTGGMLAVIGPDGAGKSHLAGLHARRSGAAGWPAAAAHLVVEDADRLAGVPAAEEELFHAFNRVVGEGGSILFTARLPVAGWRVRLADLRTRLNTVVGVALPPPDDALLFAVLLKLFADRQIDAERAAEVAAWLLPRMDRSLGEARRLVAALDERSLAEKRRLDTRLAAEVLAAGR